MAAALAVPRPLLLEHLDPAALARLGILQGTGALLPERAVLKLDWPELEAVLPDHGLPRGVVEIASPPSRPLPSSSKHGALRGGATTIALSAMHAVHAQHSKAPHSLRSLVDDRAWCAWITPSDAPSLYAPAVVQAGVDLERLLVIRPSRAVLARTAIKVASSGAFDLVVIDAQAGLEGRLLASTPPAKPRGASPKVDGAVVVRKLALASEEKGTACLVLTNAYDARETPWPVALRIEVERRPDAIAVRVTKDRRGRAASQHVVRIAS